MLAINGVYDKGKIELIKEAPIKGKRRVVVTFLDEPLVETDKARVKNRLEPRL